MAARSDARSRKAHRPPEGREPTLSPRARRFVDEYLIDLNATQAALRAGYSAKAAQVQGSRLLSNAMVQASIAAGQQRLAEKAGVSAERVIGEAWSILTADPRELVEHHVGACRHCWGNAFRYQRTTAEMDRDLAEEEAGRWAAEARRTGAPFPFDHRGGVGFNPHRTPNDACPECFGKGQGRTYINDTRKLSPAAAALYAGIKQTKDGIEVKMHSKLDAMERLSKHLGLYDRIKAPEAALAAWAVDGATLVDQGRAVLLAAAAGHVTGAQAAQLMAGLGSLARLIETTELAARVAALEKRNG